MTAEAPILVRSWSVGSRTVVMTVPRPKPGSAVHVAMEWTPDVPEQLGPAEAQQYRAGRDKAIAEIAETLQIRVAVMDV